MKTFHIHIKGQVQGLGFRPFIYLLAKKQRIVGWVNNTSNGVHIEANLRRDIEDFIDEIKSKAPNQAIIENISWYEIPYRSFDDFKIVESKNYNDKSVRISPDFAVCPSCKKDLTDPKNKRYQYAFTTCTNCGPRYSIITRLPYDRPNTTMEPIEMCQPCLEEYRNPLDRRFYSQTNSCPRCAVKMDFYESDRKINLEQHHIPSQIARNIKKGKIGAIKGIGGYLLVCDATNQEIITLLRKRKNRPDKPFALLFEDREQISRYLHCSDQEWSILSGEVAPILLLTVKNNTSDELKFNKIAPGLDKIGVMLPYAPLLQLIMEDLEFPIVATSGNLSGSPIIYENNAALRELNRFADFIVTNNREIIAPQDDSVMSYSIPSSQKIIMRRSRGMAPSYFGPLPELKENQLALGAEIKGSFAFYKNNQLYSSQYLGDLGSFDSQESYEKSLGHLTSLTELKPEVIYTDQHPGYFTNQFAQNYLHHPVNYVQHHKAHFAGLLMENQLQDSKEPILGVIWDGMGFGEDCNIWGGEFFTYSYHRFTRKYHLEYVPYILADKMSLEPRLSALSFCKNLSQAERILRKKFSSKEWKFYTALLAKNYDIKTSSIGRLFDAVASILGLIDKSTFEGQAGMYLEVLARSADRNGYAPYNFEIRHESINVDRMLEKIIEHIISGVTPSEIAYRFHDTLVELVRQTARVVDVQKIGFSGGVFQNQHLVERLHEQLSSEFDLYFHDKLSPNDENIAFGQLAYGYINQKGKVSDEISQPTDKELLI